MHHNVTMHLYAYAYTVPIACNLTHTHESLARRVRVTRETTFSNLRVLAVLRVSHFTRTRTPRERSQHCTRVKLVPFTSVLSFVITITVVEKLLATLTAVLRRLLFASPIANRLKPFSQLGGKSATYAPYC